jgi:fructokinase
VAKVVCFGEALVDFLAEAPQHYLCYAGGAPANVAVAAARLDTPAAFVGMLSRDAFGDFLLQSLKAAGVSTDCVERTDAANTALAFVSLDAEGERRFTFYRPPAADLLFRPEHFKAECFADAAVFHVCSNSLTEADIAATTLEGVRRARVAGALVSFDLNWRPNLWSAGVDPRPRIWSVLRESEIVKLCASELAFLAEVLGSQDAVYAEIWRGHTQWLLITDGAEPLCHLTRASRGELPAFEVHAVNTTGAGDAFMGGLLSALVREKVSPEGLSGFLTDGERVRSALRYATACGALAVTRHGAFEAMPSRAEVEALLSEHP